MPQAKPSLRLQLALVRPHAEKCENAPNNDPSGKRSNQLIVFDYRPLNRGVTFGRATRSFHKQLLPNNYNALRETSGGVIVRNVFAQVERWKDEAKAFRSAVKIEVKQSKEYASSIINSVWTGEPSVIYGNLRNNGCITSLPDTCAAEVPCLVDDRGIQPTLIGELPPQLTALIRTNINVQELTVRALMTKKREHVYHAAMMDPHTAAELDLDQIWHLVDDLIAAHDAWLPEWLRN